MTGVGFRGNDEAGACGNDEMSACGNDGGGVRGVCLPAYCLRGRLRGSGGMTA